MRLLLCADPLQPGLPDSAFETEVEAIERLGLAFDLLNFEALDAGASDRATRRVPESVGDLVYRGWMMSSARYDDVSSSPKGAELAGGLVFREYVELESVGRHAQSGFGLGREYRLFFVDGRLLIGGRYWNGVDYSDDYPTESFGRVAASIASRFFCMDIARTAAGEWIVMEVGDGQVSGLPDSILPIDFYARLSATLT
jgi:hypothetical protein